MENGGDSLSQKITTHTHRSVTESGSTLHRTRILSPATGRTRMNHSAQQCGRHIHTPAAPRLKPVDPRGGLGSPQTAAEWSTTHPAQPAHSSQKLSVSEKMPLNTLTSLSPLSAAFGRCLAASHSAVSTAVAVAAAAAALSCSAAGWTE